jgi:hypothetical protein
VSDPDWQGALITSIGVFGGFMPASSMNVSWSELQAKSLNGRFGFNTPYSDVTKSDASGMYASEASRNHFCGKT